MSGLMENGDDSCLRVQPLCALVSLLQLLRKTFSVLRAQHSHSFAPTSLAFRCQRVDDAAMDHLWCAVFGCVLADLKRPSPAGQAMAALKDCAREVVEGEFASDLVTSLLHDDAPRIAATPSPASLQVIRYVAGFALRCVAGFLLRSVQVFCSQPMPPFCVAPPF